MKWSFRIATIAGTAVKVHVTFVALLVFLAGTDYFAHGVNAAFTGTLFLLAVFACVLAHEFGHILMARRFGVRTPDVILLPIGGLARLERIPEEPRQELLIALAGPAVTLVLAIGLGAGVFATGSTPQFGGVDLTGSFVNAMMQVNILLLLFNLIPAFPMDGGRVLRAALASRIGMTRATKIAAGFGQAFAVLLAVYGFSRSFILVLIALFIFMGAGAEASAVATRTAGHGLRVAEMMVRDFQTLPVHATLRDAAELLLRGEQREFPVVDNWGNVEGILTRDNLTRGLTERGNGAVVADVMTASPPSVLPDLDFSAALERLRGSGLPAIPVVDAAGRLVGLLTMDNITDLLLVRRATGHG
jgi:Zn-dependent protease/predicted transcriptional regulator